MRKKLNTATPCELIKLYRNLLKCREADILNCPNIFFNQYIILICVKLSVQKFSYTKCIVQFPKG